MGLILDTCILIQAEKEEKHLPDFSRWESYGDAYICAITVSELLIGVCRANTEARRLKRSAFVETILAEFAVLDFTSGVARIHAELYSYLAEQGQLIGAHDLLIGATAIAHGYPLATLNHQEFNRVPSLKVLSN